MPPLGFYSYKIAAGYNVALGSLVNVETISAGGRYFIAPQAYGHHAPGVRKVRLTGVGYRAGYAHVDWVFGFMTRPQYEYLSTTYCGGALEGQVTVYTRAGTSTYARYNAVLSLPETEATQGAFVLFSNIAVRLSHMVAI